MKRTESFFRATDLVRVGVVLLMISVVVIPGAIKNYEDKQREILYAKMEESQAETEERMRYLKTLSADEKFVFILKDMEQEDCIITDYIISEKDNAIYICVPARVIDVEDDMAPYSDFRNSMAVFAGACSVEKNIYIAGVSPDGALCWAINEAGEIVELGTVTIDGGDAYEL